MKTLSYAVAAIGLMAGLASAGHAGVLYDNGPIDDNQSGWAIASPFAVSDSFTLTSDSILTGVRFGSISFTGDALTSVDWGIATAADVYPDQGTAAVTLSDVHPGQFGYPTSTATFALPDIALAAGTYYLVLQNGVTALDGNTFWSENDGPSTATVAGHGSAGSESFQILGPGGAVPEPAAWTTMLLGFLMIGGFLRSRRHAALPA